MFQAGRRGWRCDVANGISDAGLQISDPAAKSPRSFAIIPAAGVSARMGSPKLLLAWKGKTIIEHVIGAWLASRVTRVVVVVRPDDVELASVVRRLGVDLVVPGQAPPEMKDSVRFALAHIESLYSPLPTDVWLLAPADMPRLSPPIIDRLFSEHRPESPAILIPEVSGKRGHPVLFPWSLAAEARQLPEGEGLNALAARHSPRLVPCEDATILEDLDTPADYRRLNSR